MYIIWSQTEQCRTAGLHTSLSHQPQSTLRKTFPYLSCILLVTAVLTRNNISLFLYESYLCIIIHLYFSVLIIQSYLYNHIYYIYLIIQSYLYFSVLIQSYLRNNISIVLFPSVLISILTFFSEKFQLHFSFPPDLSLFYFSIFRIKFVRVVLVNNIMYISGIQLYNTTSIHAIICSPPEIQTSFITLYLIFYTHYLQNHISLYKC